MQIPVVRVTFNTENEVPDALTCKGQQRKIYHRPVQQAQACLARLRRERQQPSGFPANRDYHPQSVQRIIVSQDTITNEVQWIIGVKRIKLSNIDASFITHSAENLKKQGKV
jgi:hypothetical protein